MKKDKRTSTVLLIISGAIIALAVVWALTRGVNSERNKLCDIINAYGYNFVQDDLIITYDCKDTTISQVLNTSEAELEKLCCLSEQAGYAADVTSQGGVTQILATDGSDVVTIFLLDGGIQLCFVQRGDTLLPVNYARS